MSEAKLKARIVRIEVDRGEAGLYFATSPDIKGLLVAERTVEELEASIPGAISDLYAACGERIVVIPAEDFTGSHATRSWVRVPAQVAESALAAMLERSAA